ncbi:MAG TPA: FAD-dependent oxidoreductase [Chloroflexia bacterium]|nr:FAD-dependent oxidoreductase [Chloroflexia bacterium]
MNTQQAETGVVVVGGGLAGLSAAGYLARAGVPVTLFEQAAGLGGRAATQQYADYCFNRGIHALYPGGAAAQVLQELGVTYGGHRPGGVLIRHQGRLHLLPAGPGTLLRSGVLAAGDKWELMRLLTLLTLTKPAALRRQSVQGWLAAHTRRPPVRQVIAALARTFTYTAALDQVSAEVFVTQLQQALKHNVRYIDGGWQSLVDGLRRAATQAGAQIVSGCGVAAVEHDGPQVQAVRLRDGRTVPAAAVILATPPQDAARLIDGGADPAWRTRVADRGPVVVACLDVALRRLPNPRHPVVFDADQPRFLTAQSQFARIAPPGGALIHTVKYLDPAQPTDAQTDRQDLEALLDTAQPGWRSVLVKSIYLPRMEAVSWLPTARGGGLAGRPDAAVPGLAGLYLAGDWVGPTGYLVDSSLASARQVAHLLLQGGLATARAGVARQPVAAGR